MAQYLANSSTKSSFTNNLEFRKKTYNDLFILETESDLAIFTRTTSSLETYDCCSVMVDSHYTKTNVKEI